MQTQYEKMTQTSIPKLIITLSIPTILSMLITNVYNIVDTAFVGTLGNSASGAVGVVFGFMAILQAVGFLFGQGAGSLLSRQLGAHDEENASKTTSTGFFGSIIVSIIVAVFCAIFLDDLVMALGSTVTIAPYAKTYIAYILAVAPLFTSSFTLNNLLRYEGRAMLGMVGMMAGAIINIAGDAVFIFGLNMGIEGAGLSTAISQVISFSILLSMFLCGKTQSKISFKYIDFRFKFIWNVVATGFPSLLRQGLGSVATIVLNMCASQYGDEGVAGMSIVSRIFFFILSVAIGVGQGFQPVSGFNFGAKKYSRLKDAYIFTVKLATALVVVIGMVVYILAPGIVRILRDDGKVIEIATRSLRIHCMALPFLPIGIMTEMLFQSTGKKLWASIFSSLRSGVVYIPLLMIMAHVRGLAGIQEAQPLAFIICSVPAVLVAILYFKKLPKEDENQEVG